MNRFGLMYNKGIHQKTGGVMMDLKERVERYRHEKEPDFDVEVCNKEAFEPCMEVLKRDLGDVLKLVGEDSGLEYEEVEVTQTFFCGSRLAHSMEKKVPAYLMGLEGSHVLFLIDPVMNILVPEMRITVRAIEPRNSDWLFRSGLGDRPYLVIRASREESETFWKVILPSPGKYLPLERKALEKIIEAVLLPPAEAGDNQNPGVN